MSTKNSDTSDVRFESDGTEFGFDDGSPDPEPLTDEQMDALFEEIDRYNKAKNEQHT